MLKPIATKEAPEAIGPYSQAIRAGGFLFTSGQIPIDPGTGSLAGEDIKEQAHRVMKNLEAVLKAGGAGFGSVVKATIFLTDLGNFGLVNEIYESYLQKPYPARSCVEVGALPKGAGVEIEMVASLGE